MSLMVDAGYIRHDHCEISEKIRVTVKLTDKAHSVLSEPHLAQISVVAIQQSSELPSGDNDDSTLCSLDKKGRIVLPSSYHKWLIENDSSKEAIKIMKWFHGVANEQDDSMEVEDNFETEECKSSSSYSTLNSSTTAAMAASEYISSGPITNVFKARESSHANIDNDLFRTCSHKCPKSCRNVRKLCDSFFWKKVVEYRKEVRPSIHLMSIFSLFKSI